MVAIAAPALAAYADEAAAVQSDFSTIDSLAAAQALAEQGKLVPVLLFPAELGGQDIALNKVYITPQAAAARERAVVTIITMLEADKVDQMDVKPAYKGRSFVPSSITMQVWHSEKDGRFEVTIPVW
jgi:hypothetical protein